MKNKFFLFLASLLIPALCMGMSSANIEEILQDENNILNYCYTPMQFGAVGNGKADDTNALRKALYQSDKDGKILYFPSGKTFKVTGTLNYYQGKYQSYTLNMIGSIPVMKGSYVPEEYGGITVAKGVKLFKDAAFKGSIEKMCITGQRDLETHVFNNCTCSGLVVYGCNFANFGAMFLDTSVDKVSRIQDSKFLTVFYFARNVSKSCGFTDSMISGCYINGGMEQNDNACFEWGYYNGVTITGNFIDYYRTIYAPKAVSKQAFVGPTSFANQYQVFRYLYYPGDNITTVTFSSVSDSFNWNDPETLDKLAKFVPIKYKGKDGKSYDLPPFVAMCNATWNITITDAKIERNMKALVFVNSSLTEFEYNRFDVSFTGNNQYKAGQINYKKGDPKPFYNNGKYPQNAMNISGIVEVLDKMPSVNAGWSESVPGRNIQVGGKVYKSVNSVNEGKISSSSWQEKK